ncbi:hypothetical protein [Chitinophaga sp. LS1]|uniref:hypothetical protein n=1 Tax=Chitinophaga sp. LS1 TaxID=3051176 RepID=UPI002AAC065C|nr:hypothetical protein [Chitinophaga sp. LS1]WPV67069.1 hypothetical protein QQL36_35350 [Chitinophaga sp. LS1]
MNKEEYYNTSEKRNLPLRCPRLSNCSRYRYTAYFIGKTCYKVKSDNTEDNMKSMGILDDNERISEMLEAGNRLLLLVEKIIFTLTMHAPNSSFIHTNTSL